MELILFKLLCWDFEMQTGFLAIIEYFGPNTLVLLLNSICNKKGACFCWSFTLALAKVKDSLCYGFFWKFVFEITHFGCLSGIEKLVDWWLAFAIF